MSLAERVEKSLKEEQTVRENKHSFQNLREFYAAMKKEGVAIKQEYTLPLIDIVGRSLCENEQAPTKRNE